MILTFEDLIELAEGVSRAIGKPFVVFRNTKGAWYAGFPKNTKDTVGASHDTAKEALVAALKAAKPIKATEGI